MCENITKLPAIKVNSSNTFSMPWQCLPPISKPFSKNYYLLSKNLSAAAKKVFLVFISKKLCFWTEFATNNVPLFEHVPWIHEFYLSQLTSGLLTPLISRVRYSGVWLTWPMNKEPSSRNFKRYHFVKRPERADWLSVVRWIYFKVTTFVWLSFALTTCFLRTLVMSFSWRYFSTAPRENEW